MRKDVLMGTLVALALASSATFAKDDAKAPASPPGAKAPAPPPGPPPELSQLDFFVGTWSCTGNAPASPMAAEHATAATVHVVKALGGRWLHVDYDEKKTATNPLPFHAGIYMGYDNAKKAFVENCVDAFGGYCTQSGTGWKGDTMTFEGTANGMGPPGGVRDTFTKKGANEVKHTGEMQGEDKKWVMTDEETCHKAK